MNSKETIESYLYIGKDKLSFCIFNNIDQKIYEKETLLDSYTKKNNLVDLVDLFFEENVLKIEKKINKFVNEINLIFFDSNFIPIQAGIKKSRPGEKINNRDLYHMLFDLKQQIKENNADKTIIHMRINNFLIDKKRSLILDNNFDCSELCLEIDFVCLSNEIIDILSKKTKKYQISISKIFSAEYLEKNYKLTNNDECITASRFKHENDENEVHLIKKIPRKKGFFERFFSFFTN